MRKKLALIMAALILNISIMTTAVLPAQALPVTPVIDGLYESFSKIFSNAWGMFKTYDNMTYNYTIDRMQSFFNSMLGKEPFEWDEDTTISGLDNKSGMLEFIDNSLNLLRAYHSVNLQNQLYDKLNEQSYNASGTLSTKTMEENLIKAREMVSALNEGEYSSTFEMMADALWNEQQAGAAFSAINYKLFEAIQNGLIVNSNYDANSTWFEPVENSIYGQYDIYRKSFVYEGNIIPVYYLNGFSYQKDDGTVLYKIEFSDKVWLLPLTKGVNGLNVRALSDKPVVYTIKYINKAGEITYTNSSNGSDSGKGYYIAGSAAPGATRLPFMSFDINGYSASNLTKLQRAFDEFYYQNLFGSKFSSEVGGSISTVAPEFTEALDDFWNKDLTAEDVFNLGESLDVADSVAGTVDGLDTLTDIIAGITTTLPDAIVDGKNDVVQAVDGLGEKILTLPKAIWLEFEGVLEGIRADILAKPWEGVNEGPSSDIIILFNGLFLLIMIILALLRIFIHCLQFIINIFKIPASTAFLPEDMVMGLNYIKTLEIPGIGLSVYNFMMGLIYIFIVFFAIRLLRVNIDRLKIPKMRNGGIG